MSGNLPVVAEIEAAASTGHDLTLVGRQASRATITPSRLRAYVDDRITDVGEWCGRLEELIGVAHQGRSAIAERLDDAETKRRLVLSNADRYGGEIIHDASECSLELRTRLSAVDARIGALQRRLQALHTQRRCLAILRGQLDEVVGLDTARVSERAARLHRASRDIYRLVGVEVEAIAADLHAGPVPLLSDLVFAADILDRDLSRGGHLDATASSAFQDQIRAALAELSRFVSRVRPLELDRSGPVAALRALGRDLGRSAGIRVRLHVVGAERRMTPGRESVLYRVVEAALRNVERHAHTGSADVVVSFAAERIVAIVRDDGEGFDLSATQARLGKTTSMGMIGMHQRAMIEKGTLDVRSQLGAGTEVRLTLPA